MHRIALLILFLIASSFSTKKSWHTLTVAEKTTICKSIATEVYNRIESQIPVNRRPFVKRFAWLAIYDYNEYGVLASVKLAQGGVECGFGTILDRGLQGNNYFSVKCREKNHSEDHCFVLVDGGEPAHFIKYANAFDSFRAHSIHLQRNYPELFQCKNYKEWTAKLTGKYAKDKTYGRKLNSIIESYGFTEFDVKI